MNRHRLLAAVVLVLAFGGAASTQDPLDEFFRKQEDRLKRIVDWEKERQRVNAEQWRRAQERMKPFWLMIEGQLLQAENKFAEAAKKMKEASRAFAKSGTPKSALDYRDTLLYLAQLQVVMGNQEEARQQAELAWKVHQKAVAGGRARDWPDELQVALRVALVLLAGDRPEKAAELVQHAEEISSRLATASLVGEVCLTRSMLSNSTGSYQAARAAGVKAAAQFRKQFPRDTYPHGHPQLAAALVNLAMAHVGLEESELARSLLQEADRILTHHAPLGQPLRAEIYRILGHLKLQRGQVTAALGNIDRARKMFETLFPPGDPRYRRSHPALIQALTSLADLLNQHGQSAKALPHAEAAWKQCRRRYQDAPHEQAITTRLCYGRCLRNAGQLDKAQEQFEAAVRLADQLASTGPRRDGLFLAALCRMHLGSLFGRRGDYRQARQLLQQAQATYQRSAPEDHPHRFAVSAYLGVVALQHDDRDGARTAFAQALEVYQKRLRRFVRAIAQVEDLTFGQPRQLALDGYLGATRGEPAHDEQAYAWVWAAKGAATRLAEARYAALRLQNDPHTRALLARMVDACARLRQELVVARDRTSFGKLLQELDRLEAELIRAWPKGDRPAPPLDPVPHDLAARLPPGSAFVDFVRYQDFSRGAVLRPHYVAFLLLPGRPARRIELGPAGPIDRAVRAWREGMEQWKPGSRAVLEEELQESDRLAAAVRQKLQWERIERLLPSGTRLLLLAPDGDLARFPFAALPAAVPGKVLLEDCSVAYVPSGPFLLQRLLRPGESGAGRPERFLAVGEVDYGAGNVPFGPLPGSRAVIELAQRVATTRPTRTLSKKAATVAALLHDLPGASEAHLATHGSFDEKGFNQEHEQLARAMRSWPRLDAPVTQVGAGRRFPLSFVYVALAGANQPVSAGRAGGLLTGEAIPRLRLAGLHLAVLDACDTGLGTFTAGEGVQGLQRAFHLAGCPNVVATLWHVKDVPAAVLTKEFYRQRWQNHLPSLEALRRAQLALYREPGRLPFGAGTRSHPQMWGAAYVHSGIGHPFVLPAQVAEQVARLEADEAARGEGSPWTDRFLANRGLLWGGLGVVVALALFVVVLVRRRARLGLAMPAGSELPRATDAGPDWS